MGKELAACLKASNLTLAFAWLTWEFGVTRPEILVLENIESVWYLYVQGSNFKLTFLFLIEITNRMLRSWQKNELGLAQPVELSSASRQHWLASRQGVVVIIGWRSAQVWSVTDTLAGHGLVGGGTMSFLLIVRVLILLAWGGKPWVYGGLLKVAEGISALQVTGMLGLCSLVQLCHPWQEC